MVNIMETEPTYIDHILTGRDAIIKKWLKFGVNGNAFPCEFDVDLSEYADLNLKVTLGCEEVVKNGKAITIKIEAFKAEMFVVCREEV